MNAIQRKVGLVFGGALVAVSVWACAATRNSNGSVTFRFAPDMTITSWGLEGALRDLTGLLKSCNDGTFPRPCTLDEINAIGDIITEVLERKRPADKPSRPGSLG